MEAIASNNSAPNVAPRKTEIVAAKLVVILKHADHPDEPARLEIALKGEGEALFERESVDRAFELVEEARKRLEAPPPSKSARAIAHAKQLLNRFRPF